jgi:hypothetical protein
LCDAYRNAGLTSEKRREYVRISHIQRLLNSGRVDASLHWTYATAEAAIVA